MATNSKKKNGVVGVVALTLAGVLVGGAIGGAVGYILGKDKKEETPSEIVTPVPDPVTGADKGGGMEISGTENKYMSARMTKLSAESDEGIDPQAESSYLLTITVKPEESDDTKVDVEGTWKNASSTWASGKNFSDYITLTQATDGATNITVTCKQAFAEQGNIKVTSRMTPSVSLNITVDYVKKFRNTNVTFKNGSTTYFTLNGDTSATAAWTWVAPSATDYYNWGKGTLDYSDNFSIGTVDNAVKSHSITITTSSALRTQLAKTSFTSFSSETNFVKTCYETTMTFTNSLSLYGIFGFGSPSMSSGSGCLDYYTLFGFCSDMVDYGEDELDGTDFNKVKTCLKASATDFVITIKTELTEGGIQTATYNVNVTDSSIATKVTSMSANTTNIRF